MKIVLASRTLLFSPGTTTRSAVERELGVAFSYPARGWHTYALAEAPGTALLSAFYRDRTMIAVELYLPRSDRAPDLEPRDLGGCVLQPGGVTLGMDAGAVGAPFTELARGELAAIVYDRHFEAAFDGGVAHAMSIGGRIERLTIYAGAPAT